jgi:hypothetical protein
LTKSFRLHYDPGVDSEDQEATPANSVLQEYEVLLNFVTDFTILSNQKYVFTNSSPRAI